MGLGTLELLMIGSLVGVFVFARRRRGRATLREVHLGRLPAWVLMFGLGVTFYWVRSLGFGEFDGWVAFAIGSAAIVVYWFLRQGALSLSLRTVPLYLLIAAAIRSIAVDLVFAVRSANPEFVFGWINPTRWMRSIWFLATSPFALVEIGALVGVAYYLIQSSRLGSSQPRGSARRYPMQGQREEATRLALGAAVLKGSLFRQSVIARARNKYMAVAPELGIDVGRVVAACIKLEQRETRYQIGYAVLLVAWMISVSFGPAPMLLVLVVLVAVHLQKSYVNRFKVAPRYTQRRFRQTDSQQEAPGLTHSDAQGIPRPDQNIVVYKDFDPFRSAGHDLGGWSFALDCSRPKQGVAGPLEPQPVNLKDLYDALGMGIAALGLGNLDSGDYYFVHGSDLRSCDEILPSPYRRPVQFVAPEILEATDKAESVLRRYKWLRFHDWGGDIVVSYLFRCSIQGSNMFVEVARFLLPPIAASHRGIDSLEEPSFDENVVWGLVTAVAAPFAAAFGALLLLGKAQARIAEAIGTEDKATRRQIRRNPRFNYGSSDSLRRTLASTSFHHYFQKMDWEMYIKSIDRQLLDTIVDFLDEHNIDVSDVKERQSTILNNGIIVQSGNVTAQNLAVGQRASAGVVQRFTGGAGSRQGGQKSQGGS